MCEIFSTVCQALQPLAVGAVMAYLLNFIAASLESRWFPRSTNVFVTKSRRPICVILAIAAVTLALVALITFVGSEFKSVGSAIINGVSEGATMASQAIANLPGAEKSMILNDATWSSLGEKALAAIGGTDQALRIVAQTSGEVAHVTLSILLGMIFALYLLLDKDRVHAGRHAPYDPHSQRRGARARAPRMRHYQRLLLTLYSRPMHRGSHLGYAVRYRRHHPAFSLRSLNWPYCGRDLAHSVRRRMDRRHHGALR